MIVQKIYLASQQRKISRLCHFTPSRNLPGIAEGKIGVLATRSLLENERAVFRRESARLKLAGVGEETYKFVISADLFEPYDVSGLIRSGQRPKEVFWDKRKS